MARIAARLLDAPCARISLATPTSHVPVGGFGIIPGPADDAERFLALAMNSGHGLIVRDVPDDPRFRNDPLSTATPGIRFFAGVPLIGSFGHPIGTVCVMDSAPRVDVSPQALDDLRMLALAVEAWLERWRLSQVEHTLRPVAARDDANRRFEALADALPQLVWSTRNDGWSDYFSQQWCSFTGAPASASFGTGWLDFVHPEDVPVAREAWRRAVETGEPYTTEFRLRHADGTYRWMLARGLPTSDEFGRINRWIGTCTDIDERVRTGDLMEFMTRELSHRIKNLFAVVQGLISMVLRKHPGMEQANQALQARMVALGRAHDLVRPRIAHGSILRSHTTLHQLIRILTLPYVEDDPSRLDIVGDDISVDERAVTPLTLFFHEMAINSARFGAFSVLQGHLRITIAIDQDMVVQWHEHGGPPITRTPLPAFGLGLTRLSIERQLGGTLTLAWPSSGMQTTARIPLHQLNAG